MNGCSFVTLQENNSLSLCLSVSLLPHHPLSFLCLMIPPLHTTRLCCRNFNHLMCLVDFIILTTFTVFRYMVQRIQCISTSSADYKKKVPRCIYDISNKTTSNKIYFIPCFSILSNVSV